MQLLGTISALLSLACRRELILHSRLDWDFLISLELLYHSKACPPSLSLGSAQELVWKTVPWKGSFIARAFFQKKHIPRKAATMNEKVVWWSFMEAGFVEIRGTYTNLTTKRLLRKTSVLKSRKHWVSFRNGTCAGWSDPSLTGCSQPYDRLNFLGAIMWIHSGTQWNGVCLLFVFGLRIAEGLHTADSCGL